MGGTRRRQVASTTVSVMRWRDCSRRLPGLGRSSHFGAAHVGAWGAGCSDFLTVRPQIVGDAWPRICGRTAARTNSFASRRRLWFCRDRAPVRRRVDDGRLRLFCRPSLWRTEADARCEPEENLVGRNRRYRRSHVRCPAGSRGFSDRSIHLRSLGLHSCFRSWRNLAICSDPG